MVLAYFDRKRSSGWLERGLLESFSGFQSPRWPFSMKVCYSCVQTIFLFMVLLSTSLSSLSSSLCQDPKRIWGNKRSTPGSLLNPKSLFVFNESSNVGYLPYLACGGVRPFSRTPGRCRDVPLVKQCASGYCHPTKSSTGIMWKGQMQNFIALLYKISEQAKSVDTGSEDPLSTFSCGKKFSIC